MGKKDLSEEDIKARYITPAVEKAGWNKQQIRYEYAFTAGRIILRGSVTARGKQKRADYLLFYKQNLPLAIIEAKDNSHPVGAGLQQAVEYAQVLDVKYVYASNGDGFVEQDLITGDVRNLSLEEFPSPDELYQRYLSEMNISDAEEKVLLSPYYYVPGYKQPRYYQRIAINRTVDAIASGRDRVLLVCATGTGKTFMAFQIIYRLWKAGIKKKILFLADRNVLVDQTISGDFKPFGGKMTKKLLEEFNLHTVVRMPHSVFAPYTSITTNILFFDNTHPTEETWFYRVDMPDGYKNFSKTKPMKLEHFQPALDWWDNRTEIMEDGFPKAKKYTAEDIVANGYNIDLCGYPHEEEEILDPMDLINQYQEKRAALNAEIDDVLGKIVGMLKK